MQKSYVFLNKLCYSCLATVSDNTVSDTNITFKQGCTTNFPKIWTQVEVTQHACASPAGRHKCSSNPFAALADDTEDLYTTVQNLFAWVTWCLECVHPSL
jgi:hypothetical protein